MSSSLEDESSDLDVALVIGRAGLTDIRDIRIGIRPTDRIWPYGLGDPPNTAHPTNRAGPTDRADSTNRADPFELASLTDGASSDSLARMERTSPSILDHLRAGHSLTRNPVRSRPIFEVGDNMPFDAPRSSVNDTYVTPIPRDIANRLSSDITNLRRVHAELSMVTELGNILGVAENTIMTRMRARRERREQAEQRIEEPEPVVHSEDSSSSEVVSTASEDSNHSLPEDHVQVNTETVKEPPAKVRKINSPDKGSKDKLNKSNDSDGETCPICLEMWGNTGKHRLVALKCGHLFGAECVERWLKAQPRNNRYCPTCKSHASLKELRCIYARKLVTADKSEITRLQEQVEILQTEKSRTELQLHTAKLTQRSLAEQVETLKKTIAKSHVKEAVTKVWRYSLEKNLEICRTGGCRVMTYNCKTYELFVSQKSNNYIFPGYGVKKVNCVNNTTGAYVPLHPKPIRDIVYSQPSDLLLTASLDGTSRIISRGVTNTTVDVGFPLWSCAWDHHKPNEFYVGGIGGLINQFDYRNPTAVLRTLSSQSGDMSPVVSICSTKFGLLTCQLNSCLLWETHTGNWVPKAFPVTGAYMSMSYDDVSQLALISTRPKGAERSKLTLCSLKSAAGGGTKIEVNQVINGSARTSVMSRATFCKTSGASWVAAHSESDAALYLHGYNGSRTMSLPAAEPALDVCSFQVHENFILASLSESRLRIYKAHSLLT